MSQLIIHLVRFRHPINLFNAISSIILIGSPTLRCCSLIGRGWGPDSGASQVRAESSDGGKKTKDVWFSVQKVSSFNLRHYILLCRARRRGGKSCSTPPWSGLLEPSSLLEESLDNIQTLEHYKHGDGNKRSFYIIYQLLNCSTIKILTKLASPTSSTPQTRPSAPPPWQHLGQHQQPGSHDCTHIL